jgi:hypothetical protein
VWLVVMLVLPPGGSLGGGCIVPDPSSRQGWWVGSLVDWLVGTPQ